MLIDMNQYIRAEAFAFFALFFAIYMKVYAFENLKSLKFSKKGKKSQKTTKIAKTSQNTTTQGPSKAFIDKLIVQDSTT